MLQAGLVIPTFKTIPVELVPGPKQGITLVASIDQFDKLFTEYSAELKAKAKQNEKVYLLNSSQILCRMNLMRYAATIPGFLNDKLAALGKPAVYDGPYGGVSQWEREAIGERTRDAMRHKKAKLEFVGNAPYGYRQAADKRHVEPEPDEQAILQRIHRLRNGGKSLRKIADQLNRLKIRTRQGSPWRHEYVARLLKAA
jgi:hypothetical protein